MLREIVDSYLEIFPKERDELAMLRRQIAAGDVLNNRTTLPGHITGAALVLSPDRQKILLIYHKIFDRWLQPGGHWDPGEPSPWQAARREAEEETAVTIARQLRGASSDLRVPIMISSHPIPARPDKNEPAHYHHDFRYLFLAAEESLVPQLNEVRAAAWFDLDAPECASIARDIVRLRHYADQV